MFSYDEDRVDLQPDAIIQNFCNNGFEAEQALEDCDNDESDILGGVATEQLSESALSYYMQRIANCRPLTKKEERDLGEKIKEGDREAFEKLVNANLKFVITVAYRYKNSGMPMADIINQGNLGLLKAAKRYDPCKGVKFISYAVWWIRQYIVQGIAEQSGVVKFPIKQTGNLFRVRAAKELLTQRNGREATDSEVASHLNMKASDVTDILRFSRQALSLETPLKDGEEKTFIEFLKSPEESLEDNFCKKYLKLALGSMINELDPREKEIIYLRFGFENDEALTLDELGRRFGVSRERIRQIESKALKKLKKKAARKGLQNFLVG